MMTATMNRMILMTTSTLKLARVKQFLAPAVEVGTGTTGTTGVALAARTVGLPMVTIAALLDGDGVTDW